MKSFDGQRKPRLLAYPNSGEVFDCNTYKWKADTSPGAVNFEDLAVDWVKKGVSVIGGCCRVEPDPIKAVKNKLSPVA